MPRPRTTQELFSGWCGADGGPVDHYFPPGATRSICGRHPFHPGHAKLGPGSDRCRECLRRLGERPDLPSPLPCDPIEPELPPPPPSPSIPPKAVAYHGRRTPHEPCVVLRELAGEIFEPLMQRLNLYRVGRGELDWGPGDGRVSVGASRLAIAILGDHLSDDRRARALFWKFKQEVVVAICNDRWTLSAEDVAAWLAMQGDLPATPNNPE